MTKGLTDERDRISLFNFSPKIDFMKNNWENLDIIQLQHLYHEYSQQLERNLLHGASWKEVSGQRREVTALAVVIYQRLNPTASNPAEESSRRAG